MTEIVVPDASVILKWVLPKHNEPDYERALRLRQLAIQETIIFKVPPLWLYEVGNTLSRDFPKQAKELIELLTMFNLNEVHWTKEWLHQCVYLVQRYKVTFYDAAYHSLAIVEKGTFVTADKQYAKKTRAIGSVETIDNWTHL
jgi:predicted nucleic acid-binding protein